MTTAALDASPRERVVAQFRELVDALRELPLSAMADGELLELVRELETERTRLDGADHQLVAEIDTRRLAFEYGCRDTTALLTLMLRIDPGRAKARVCAARDLGPRVGLSGEQLEPIYPLVAAAVASGAISSVHACIVTETIDALPADVQTARGIEIEQTLVDEATKFGPRDLRLIARRLHETYDQDGRLASDEDRARRRFLDVRAHADGTVSGSFHTDAETGEALLAVLDAGSKPKPATDGTADPRSARQRRHDALGDLLLLGLRSGELPATGGVTTTIVLMMTPEQFARARCSGSQTHAPREGRPRGPTDDLVRTGHGALLSLEQVEPLVGDARVFPVVLDSVRGVQSYGSLHRIFTEGQRLAMTARDRGCSFPGCSVPPAWCEAHHVIEASAGGATSVANGTLLCGMHHREFARLGYRCVMLDGIPHWIAPAWIDPSRTPTRNTAHTAGE